MESPEISLTSDLLLRARSGDGSAGGALLEHVYDELRELAAAFMRHERSGHTLQPTALVHEAYVRLVDARIDDVQTKRHFMGIAARAMRQILIQHARRRATKKRGGDLRRVPLDAVMDEYSARGIDVLQLDDALDRLAGLDARMARVVELRFFAGMKMNELADALGVSRQTAESDWYMARAWLRTELG